MSMEAAMADEVKTIEPVSEDKFIADRRAFWDALMSTVPYVVVGIAVLLLVLWWLLV